MSKILGLAAAAFVVLAILGLPGWERPPMTSVQLGVRGTGTEVNFNPRTHARLVAKNAVPAPVPPVPAGDSAPGNWKNVQVLGDLSNAEFNRTMVAITAWVAPAQGCTYCHNAANFASDSLYTKVTARRMLQMVRDINQHWQPHVAGTGVTCYSCHRGAPVPANLWYYTGVNQPLRHYLDRQDVRIQSHVPLADGDTNRSSVKQAEYAYSLMLNISRGLGVNCTFCHNSRQWFSWDAAGSGNRLVALRGIRMVRHLNTEYLVPLQSVLPATRHGPHGDSPKVECATCHNGAYKPLFGAKMAKDYPALLPPPAEADSFQAPPPESRTPEVSLGSGH